MNPTPSSNKAYHWLLAALAAACVLATRPAEAVTLTENSTTEWVASNGIVTFSVDPQTFNIFKLSVTLNGTTTNWMDGNYTCPFGHAIELYSIYSYDNPSGIRGNTTASYHLSGSYLDIWVDKPNIPGTDPLDVENHWVIRDGDPGIHFYQVLRHTAADAATNFGAATVNFFPSGNAIVRSDGSTMLYQKNTGPNNMVAIEDTFPSTTFTSNLVAADPGRQVQAETVDYTNTTLGTYVSSPGLEREFITKYNYGTYAQYHVAHGYVSNSTAFWWVVPSPESMNGGPTKQFLSGVQIEYQSAHLGGQNLAFTAGQVGTHIYGPFYLHFNAFNGTLTTADALYNDAANTTASCLAFYDGEGVLTGDGYRKQANRVTVTADIADPKGWSTNTNQNVAVLSDNATYFQESANGYQYWGYVNTSGVANITGVRPGTYRLTVYSLGQWGTYHIDNVGVGTSNVTLTGLTYQPRNFSTQNPIWTIGWPDRSAWEFLHGHDSNGHDVKNYIGSTNYWQDLEANLGKVLYTVGNSTFQFNWPFVQYGTFYPNLYAGCYNSTDNTSDGYNYITPSYVISGAATEGKTPAQFNGPPWEIHFTATSAQMAQGAYVIVSINTAGVDTSSLQVRLNGKHKGALLWYPRLGSDPEQRSGVAGYNNYAVFQFNTADLNAAGSDNVVTLYATGAILYDALKLEISPNPADPAVTGWNDYDWNYYNASDNSTTQAAASP